MTHVSHCLRPTPKINYKDDREMNSAQSLVGGAITEGTFIPRYAFAESTIGCLTSLQFAT